jgi:hypothetical protein
MSNDYPSLKRSITGSHFLLWTVLFAFCSIDLLLDEPAAVLVSATDHDTGSVECSCEVAPLPDIWNKELTARWMVHSLDWGILSTISSRLVDSENEATPIPFGNVYSFIDGPCKEGRGIPYFYGTYMDQSFIDSLENANAALTLSEAALSSVCISSSEQQMMKRNSCQIGSKHGDPENPVCARLTLTGKLKEVTDPQEKEWALDAMFERHASMKDWPKDHNWVVAKLDLTDIWLIDYFGGATIIDLEAYYNANDLMLTSHSEDADGEEKH